jgi:hypothetical protein
MVSGFPFLQNTNGISISFFIWLLIWFNEEVRVKGLALSYMKEERAYEQKVLLKYNTSRLNLISYLL